MLTVDCGSGTYIRTLCHDIGKALGAPAHMRFLLRTRAGAFSIDNAVTIEEVKAAQEAGKLEDMLLPLDWPLRSLPMLHLPKRYWVLGKNGGKLDAALKENLKEGELCRVYAEEAFLGIVRRSGDLLRFQVGLTGGT